KTLCRELKKADKKSGRGKEDAMKTRRRGQVRSELMACGVQEFPSSVHDLRGKQVPADLAPLMEKMAARLAFARASIRLYDGLINKYDAHGSFEGGPVRGDLLEMRDQGRDHFDMLCKTLGGIGADPTGLTPSTNLHVILGQAVRDVLLDTRTSLLECLEAVM